MSVFIMSHLVTICHYLLLAVTTCHYLSPPAASCHYLSLFSAQFFVTSVCWHSKNLKTLIT